MIRSSRDYYEDEINSLSHLKSVSDNPALRGPTFAYSDSVIEMRCGGSEHQRGLISLATLGIFGMFIYGWMQVVILLVLENIRSLPDFSITVLFFTALIICTGMGILYLYARHGLQLTRLEMLTSRHLLIRFNRKTQQVHLHRPTYCGGIVTFAWSATACAATHPEDDCSSVGMCLGLLWEPSLTGLPHMEMALIGKQGQGGSELRDEWEFIRRFMEEGPEGLPRPRLSTRFPSPIQAFSAQFEGIGRFFRKSSWLFKVAMLMVWPAFVVLGTCHWISLMLCWRPRWPKIIREAGQPGKPIPPLTTLSDYPPDIQKRLLANADRWELKPGKRPEKKPRKPRIKKTPEQGTAG